MLKRTNEVAAVTAKQSGKFQGFYNYSIGVNGPGSNLTILCKAEWDTFDDALADAKGLMERQGEN
jgi:hypothetical protein